MEPCREIHPKFDLIVTDIAKNQSEYKTLPGAFIGDYVLVHWKLSWRERFRILFSGNLWHWVKTFRKPLQPIMMETDKDLVAGNIYYQLALVEKQGIKCNGDVQEDSRKCTPISQ